MQLLTTSNLISQQIREDLVRAAYCPLRAGHYPRTGVRRGRVPISDFIRLAGTCVCLWFIVELL